MLQISTPVGMMISRRRRIFTDRLLMVFQNLQHHLFQRQISDLLFDNLRQLLKHGGRIKPRFWQIVGRIESVLLVRFCHRSDLQNFNLRPVLVFLISATDFEKSPACQTS